MKHIFVVNPQAGKGNKLHKLTENIREVFEAGGYDYLIYQTKCVGDAEVYVRHTCEQERHNAEGIRIYACGGDGTINECANGIVGFDNAELAAIPIGTGNDFVRNFGGREQFFDLTTLAASHAIPCDLIKYNDRYSLNMINIGYDCSVVERTDKIKQNPLIPGKLAYVFGLIAELVKKTGVSFHLRADGEDRGNRRLLLSLFANGGFYGGGFFSAPRAELADGLMDVCLVQYISRLRFISLVGKYKKGTHLAMKHHEQIFDYFKCRELELTFAAPQQICVDGELGMCDSLRLSVVSGAIRFVVPGLGADEAAQKQAVTV